MMDHKNEPERLALSPAAAEGEIAERAKALSLARGHRVIIGIAGAPGVGKSTTAANVVTHLNAAKDGAAALVPMDGFHRRHAELVAAGLDVVKGTPQTFDAESFVALLKKLRAAQSIVSAPGYSREIEDVVDDVHAIPPEVPMLITEDNYLLLDDPAWQPVRDLLDLAIFLHVPREIVYKRLITRRAEHGLFADDNIIPHVDNVDMPNYDAVSSSRGRADLIIDLITDS